MTMPKGRHLLVLLCMCCLSAISIGMLINVSGLFFAPIADELGCGRSEVSLTLTISNLVFAATGVVVARVVSAARFKPLLAVGAVLTAGGTASLSLPSSLLPLYAISAIRGFGAGLIGTVLLTTVINAWFASGTALMTSVVMGFAGIAGAVLSPVLSSVIAGAGWRFGYLVAGGISLVLCLPALIAPISLRPEDAGLLPYGTEQEGTAATPTNTPPSQHGAPSILRVAMAVTFCAVAGFVTSLPQHFPGIASSYLLDVQVGALMLSIAMIVNTAGKLLLGVLIETLGCLRASLIYCVGTLAGALGILLAHEGAMLYVCAGLVGLVYALATVTPVSLVTDNFGSANYARVYPTANLGMTAGNAVGTVVVAVAYDAFGTYAAALTLVAALIVLGVGSLTALYGSRSAQAG